MKRLLFLVISIFIYTNLVASEEKLLRVRAIFRVAPLKSNIEFDKNYYEEEQFDKYVGRPVCEELTIGRSATPALKKLVGFIGTDGKRYTCTAHPALKKDEILVIAGEFKESLRSFSMKKERKDSCCGCVWGRESVCLVMGGVDVELEKIKRVQINEPFL